MREKLFGRRCEVQGSNSRHGEQAPAFYKKFGRCLPGNSIGPPLALWSSLQRAASYCQALCHLSLTYLSHAVPPLGLLNQSDADPYAVLHPCARWPCKMSTAYGHCQEIYQNLEMTPAEDSQDREKGVESLLEGRLVLKMEVANVDVVDVETLQILPRRVWRHCL